MEFNYTFKQFLSKARAASIGGEDAWAVQSTGEKLAVALALNRADWIESMGYTEAEAVERIGPTWAELIPAVRQALH